MVRKIDTELVKKIEARWKSEAQEVLKNFKRTLKTVKLSEYWLTCSICRKTVNSKMLLVLDSRNDKYCIECADTILNWQIHRLKLFKNEIRDKGILNELEEEDDV